MLGGDFLAHPAGEGYPHPYEVNIVDRDHEVTLGVADFPVASEQYYMSVDPNNVVLAETTFNGEHFAWLDGLKSPVAWVRQLGRGPRLLPLDRPRTAGPRRRRRPPAHQAGHRLGRPPLTPNPLSSGVLRRRSPKVRKLMSRNTWFETVAIAQQRAKKRLPKSVYSSLISASEKGLTVSDNVGAFAQLGFAPHVVGAPASREMSTTVLGQEISLPVVISPTGVQAVDPDGEVAVAKAAAARGTAMGLSSFASKPIEDVVAANSKAVLPDLLAR